jgi:hypothetical protein
MLAGLRFFFGGGGASPFVLLALTLTREITTQNGTKKTGYACGLIMGLFGCAVYLMESPLIEGNVEKQYEIICPAWSGITTESLVSPSDCHEASKIITALCKLGILPQFFHQSRSSSVTSMLIVSLYST